MSLAFLFLFNFFISRLTYASWISRDQHVSPGKSNKIPPPGFPTAARVGRAVSVPWYNAYIRAWETWGRVRNRDQRELWVAYTSKLMVTSSTNTINSHWLCKKQREIDWPLIIAVMTNPDFVNSITSLQDKGMEQACVKRALEAFPNAESLRNIEGPWYREVPDIRDDELTPASEIQSGASSASSSSDASIVVSGSRSQSQRHKRHKSSHEGRHKTRSASRSADSSSRPSSSRPTTSPSAHLSSAISSSTSTPPASGPSTLANRSSSSDTSIVVSGGSSESRRRKRRRHGSSSRTRPPSTSRSAASPCAPSTLADCKSRRPFESSQI